MESTNEEDIKEEFFEACNKLEMSQLVSSVSFRLVDGMSAVEMMEPKMDIGMHRHKKHMGLQDCVSKGLYKTSYNEQIAVMDATYSMLVAYLEGSSIAQTLWTNVMIPSVNEVDHEIYTVFTHGMVHLSMACRHVIRTSYCFEEEDFNALLPYRVRSRWTRDKTMTKIREVVAKLKSLDARTRPKLKNAKREPVASESEKKKLSDIYLAVSVRLDFIVEMLQLLAYLTPPQKAANEPYVSDSDDEPLDEDEEENEELEFSPRFHDAEKIIVRLGLVVNYMAETAKFGVEAPNGEDGNFDWLLGFEPDLNHKSMPAAFPRKVVIPNRKDGYLFLSEMIRRLGEVVGDAPTTAANIYVMFDKARDFLSRSCLLSRAVLQLVMFPVDEHLYGNKAIEMYHVIETSLRDHYAPLVTIKESSVSQDPMCVALYQTFVKGIARLILDIYQIYGHNIITVREKLISHMEEFQIMLIQAGKLDTYTNEIVRNSGNLDITAHNSASTFVIDILLSNIYYILELGFETDLYVPYEYFYVHWYIGDIIHRWQKTVFQLSQEMLIQAWKLKFAVPSSKNSRRNHEKRMAEETLRDKVQTTEDQMKFYEGLVQLCFGIVQASMVLAKRGDLKVPVWEAETEKLRYELRMKPFAILGRPFYESYDEFKNLCKIEELSQIPLEGLYELASNSFESAKSFFTVINRDGHSAQCTQYAQIAKTNMVILRLLKRPEMASKKVQWVPSPGCKMYPVLKFA